MFNGTLGLSSWKLEYISFDSRLGEVVDRARESRKRFGSVERDEGHRRKKEQCELRVCYLHLYNPAFSPPQKTPSRPASP